MRWFTAIGTASRTAAKLMFVDHKLTTWARDRMVEHYPVAKLLSQIVESSRLAFPPDLRVAL